MPATAVLDSKRHATPFRFFWAVNKKVTGLFLLTSIFYGLGASALPVASWVLGKIVDAIPSGGAHIPSLIALLMALVLGYEVCYRLGHIAEIYMTTRIRRNTKRALFGHTMSLSFGFFADRFAGEIAHKINVTADSYERVLFVICNFFVENLFLLVFSLGALGLVHVWYAVFITVWGALFLFGTYLLVGPMNTASARYAEVEAHTTGALVDVYGNIPSVKVYGKEEGFRSAYRQIEEEARVFLSLGWRDVAVFHFEGMSGVALIGGLVWLTAVLYQQGAISVGAIVFVSAIAGRLFWFVWEAGNNIAQIVRARGEIAQNLRDLVAAPAVLDGDRAVAGRHDHARVEFRDVTFSYVPGHPVLSGFSLTIPEGQKVGIVGLSGAGKTTFINLLLRFFDPQQGVIALNGTSLGEVPQDWLRSHFSYISQDASLFHATIAENIAYGSPAATREEVAHAARLAHADEFIRTLPKGYESVVGERGIKLSGGQRQRIAMARALLANRPVFLFDEATSALDSDSERKIQEGLQTLMEGKTVIAVAHRLSTLSRMDRIIYLEGGKIVEAGTHAELIVLGGKYANLWNMQAGGFLPEAESDAA